ncbi:hypothetical protein AB3N02_21665 [Priestia aryabhattai]|uniref:hypothetical protein n=1 Tax=Priestia aryabhattai TaxID=412384 RepID=UPI0039A3E917
MRFDADKIRETINNSRFCYDKDGGQGFVHKSKCTCTKDNPCQSMLDKQRFNEAMRNVEYGDVKRRDEIVKQIKPEFKDSKWWKDNVIE